jgi:hypothetical protein
MSTVPPGFGDACGAGAGVKLGPGVLIGIPGIGPMVGAAARTGVTDPTLIAAVRMSRRANNGNLV